MRLLVAVLLVALGLTAAAVRFAPLVDAEEVPPLLGVPDAAEPLDATGMADLALTDLFTYLDAYRAAQRTEAILSIGWRLHECEQGGTANAWYVDGRAGNGLHVQGGLGMATSLYVGLAGHSALADTPEQQIMVAFRAKVERGAQWGEHCRPIANEWLAFLGDT